MLEWNPQLLLGPLVQHVVYWMAAYERLLSVRSGLALAYEEFPDMIMEPEQ